MSPQAKNSIELYKGNSPSQIERGLKIQKKSVVEELKEHFHATDIHELAIKLSIGE